MRGAVGVGLEFVAGEAVRQLVPRFHARVGFPTAPARAQIWPEGGQTAPDAGREDQG